MLYKANIQKSKLLKKGWLKNSHFTLILPLGNAKEWYLVNMAVTFFFQPFTVQGHCGLTSHAFELGHICNNLLIKSDHWVFRQRWSKSLQYFYGLPCPLEKFFNTNGNVLCPLGYIQLFQLPLLSVQPPSSVFVRLSSMLLHF